MPQTNENAVTIPRERYDQLILTQAHLNSLLELFAAKERRYENIKLDEIILINKLYKTENSEV